MIRDDSVTQNAVRDNETTIRAAVIAAAMMRTAAQLSIGRSIEEQNGKKWKYKR